MHEKSGTCNGAVKYLRHLLLASIITCMFLALAGCNGGSAEEIAYKGKVEAVRVRHNELFEREEATGKEFESQIDAVLSREGKGDPMGMLSELITIKNAYLPIYQQYLAEFEQIRNEMYGIDPIPAYVDAYPLFLEGIDGEFRALSDLVLAMDLIGNVQRSQEALNLIDSSMKLMDESHDKLQQAYSIVFETGWIVIALVPIVGLPILVGCGFWSGRIAPRRLRAARGNGPACPTGEYPGQLPPLWGAGQCHKPVLPGVR